MSMLPPPVAPLKSWHTLKTVRADYVTYIGEHERGQLAALQLYVETGRVHVAFTLTPEPLDKFPVQSEYSGLWSGLSMTARMKICAQQLCDQEGQSPSTWRQAVLYAELNSLLEFKFEPSFFSRFGRNRRNMEMGDAAWLGLAAGVGAMEVLERWAPLLIEGLKRDYVFVPHEYPVLHFILRLWARARGVDYPEVGYPKNELTEGLLDLWDTQDTALLGAWLVQLCNLHTQRARYKQFMDFGIGFSHVPVEVFMLFRLREQRGLPNPEVDHPLMKFPWSAMQPVQKAEPDELLSGIYRRLEQDEGLTVKGLYADLLGRGD